MSARPRTAEQAAEELAFADLAISTHRDLVAALREIEAGDEDGFFGHIAGRALAMLAPDAVECQADFDGRR